MTLQQVFALGKAAKNAGYSVAVKQGLFQLQTIQYKPNGVSIVTPQSGWIDYEEAMKMVTK